VTITSSLLFTFSCEIKQVGQQ